MKIQKAKRVCMAQGAFRLLHGPDADWLATGKAAWECTGMRLTEKSIRHVFDLTEKQLLNLYVQESDIASPIWTAYLDADRDVLLEDKGLIDVDGASYRVLVPQEEQDKRPVYIEQDLIAPVLRRDASPEYRLRIEGDVQAVAVCYGLEVAALIGPESRRMTEPDEDSPVRYGADRIEQRIRELYAIAGETTAENMLFERRWSFLNGLNARIEEDEE